MRILLFTTILALGCSISSPAQVPGASDSLRAQATRMVNSLLSYDFTSFLHYVHPRIIQLAGGTVKMRQSLQATFKQFDSMGLRFQSVTVDSASNLIKNGTEWQATILQHTTMMMQDNRMAAATTLIAISADNGAHWKFIDTNHKTLADVRQILPNVSTKLVIPPQ